MTEEKKRPENQPYSLEELNQQFGSSITKKKEHKGRTGILLLVILAAGVLMSALIIGRIMPAKQSVGEHTEEVTDTADSTRAMDLDPAAVTENYNQSILSEEEQEKWTATDQNMEDIYVELNSRIYLDGNKAYIRLINPIYSVFYYSITISPVGEEDTVLYQSQKIAPGTILEAVLLAAEPTKEQYQAVVKYLVYDGDGNELGTYSVNVEFTTDEQYK